MPTENNSSAYEGNPNLPDLISKLGDDVLVAILIRLPDPRSACRCKTVCKRWSSLIFSPGFNRLFVSHHRRRRILLLPSANFSPSSLLSFLPVPDGAEGNSLVLDSFNDLVLCGTFEKDGPVHGKVSSSYMVCNPFTKQWIALPVAPPRPEGWSQLVLKLVCEPVTSINLDLGQDEEEESVVYSPEYRFRVVCMYMLGQSINLDVFCSESGEWTSRALVLDGYRRLRDLNVVSWNGELFWACSKPGVAALLVRVNPFLGKNPKIH